MKLLCEKIVYTDTYAGTIDLLTGFEDFEVDVSFDSEWHTYEINKQILPSVTQILDDGSYDKVDEEILKYAQDKGTIVHQEIQDWIESGKDGFTVELDEFKKLFNDNKELFEQKAIFDFKTYAVATPKNRKKCFEQTSMYAEAVKYLTGEEVEHLYLVHLPHNKPARIYDLKKEFEKDPVL